MASTEPTLFKTPALSSENLERPPSYSDQDDEHVGFAVQQTTTTITTTTTTSFFPRLKRRVTAVRKSSETVVTNDHASQCEGLLINKALPEIPVAHSNPKSTSQRRPKTADPVVHTSVSTVAASVPFALAHASLGADVTRIISQNSSLPLHPQGQTSHRPSTATGLERSSHKRLSLSLSSNAYISSSVTSPVPPHSASSGPGDSRANSTSSQTSPTSWNSPPASILNSSQKRNRPLHSLSSPTDPPNSKQVARRASWWGRRRQDSPSPMTELAPSPQRTEGMSEPPSLPSELSAPRIERGASSSSITPRMGVPEKHRAHTIGIPITDIVDLTQSPSAEIDGPDFSSSSRQGGSQSDHVNKSASSLSGENFGAALSGLTSGASSRRPRALSLFLKPSNSESAPISHSSLASNSSAAHPRVRAAQSPPLLRRISSTLFSHSPYSSTSPTPNSSLSISGVFSDDAVVASPAPFIPKPKIDEETPETYVERLVEVVSKAEIANVLASKGDEFHVKALKAYLERFTFTNDPLDIAVRRLLVDLSLPRETQQIDRVMDAFAVRYMECNPGVFTEKDHAYILSFSLIMLHTDAFNKSNKTKMSKAAYVKNAKLPGMRQEILEYFYDNIVFAPFIFIEDPVDINGQRGFTTDSASSTSGFLKQSNKIDPYYLITRNLLDPLRVDVEQYVSSTNPYRYLGTAESWDHEELRQAFARASIVELGDRDASRRMSAAHLNLAFSGFTSTAPSVIPLKMAAHSGISPTAFNDVWTFKLTKIGVINRKEDTIEGGKKATARKWRQFKVALTGSQLLLFRDLRWDQTLTQRPGSRNTWVLPPGYMVKPDEIISLNDAVAILDLSYQKYRNTFRLLLPKGRQFLLQVSDEHELNEWLARINYASAFKTAGLRMRPTALSSKDVELTGIAAANSHVRESNLVQPPSNGTPPATYDWKSPVGEELETPPGEQEEQEGTPSEASSLYPVARTGLLPINRSTAALDVESAEDLVKEDVAQLKATFEDVKAELAAGPRHSSGVDKASEARAQNTEPSLKKQSSWTARGSEDIELSKERLSSRGTVLQLKIAEIEKRVAALQGQLDADLLFARNVAISTPFQNVTRSKLQEHVRRISSRVVQVRLELVKLQCHLDVLHTDFVDEERQRYHTTRTALKVATATLRQRLGGQSLSRVPSPESIALPTADKFSPPSQSGFHTRHGSSSSSGPSSTISSGTINAPPMSGKPTNSNRFTLRPSVMKQKHDFPLSPNDPEASVDDFSPGSKPEEAEEWNKTRAGKRVSLVTVRADALKPFIHRGPAEDALEHLREQGGE